MDEQIIVGTVLNALSLEDSIRDFEIICEQLTDAGYHLNISRVEKEKEFESLLRSHRYDIILADFKLPGFDAFGALRLRNAICPEVPFICVSGSIGEETAIDLIRLGAEDYVLKDRLARLPFAVRRALDGAAEKKKRKQAEESLRNSEELFRNLFQHHTAVKLIIDPDTGSIIDANKAAVKYYGWTHDQITHMKIQEINTLSPEDVKKEMEKARVLERIHFEFQHRRADGSVRDVEIFSSNIRAHGKDVLHSIIHDITERKRAESAIMESEKDYRELFENSVMGVSEAMPDGHLIRVNMAYAKMYGYDNPRQIIDEVSDIGQQLYAYPEDRLKVLKILAEKGEMAPTEFLVKRRDQSRFYVIVSARETRDAFGNLMRYQATHLDITARKEAEEKIRKLNDELEQKVQERTAELKNTIKQLEELNHVFVGRELKMIELKAKIAELEKNKT